MHQTDNLIHITGVVYASRPAYYNKETKKHVLSKGYLVSIASDYLMRRLDLQKQPIVVLKKLKKMKEFIAQGQTFPNGRVELNPTLPIEELMLIASHEFIHLDQFEEGRLKFQTDNYGNFTNPVWKGKVYSISRKDEKDFDYYRGLPWEREAYTAADRVYRDLRKHLNKIVGSNTIK